jgi:hypothetical protein
MHWGLAGGSTASHPQKFTPAPAFFRNDSHNSPRNLLFRWAERSARLGDFREIWPSGLDENAIGELKFRDKDQSRCFEPVCRQVVKEGRLF